MNFLKTKSLTFKEMAINPDRIISEPTIKNIFGEYECYSDLKFAMGLMTDLRMEEVVKYIVLLYSEDSILNTRPPMPLDERQARALELAGLKEISPENRKALIELHNRPLFEFIFEYLTKQKKFVWQEIITLETQILENQKLRMRPVDADGSKDELSSFEKKGKMTIMYKQWYLALKESYDEFYGDNENVRAIHRINRANMASLENIAF